MSESIVPLSGSHPRFLRPGCHVLSFVITHPRLGEQSLQTLVGTLRVVDDAGMSFSGDLYAIGKVDSAIDPSNPNASSELEVTLPGARYGVPIFPDRGYHSYLRGLSMETGCGGGIRLILEQYRFDMNTNFWAYFGSFVAELEKAEPSEDSPSQEDDWVGFVRNAAGTVIGVLSVTWASAFFRKAMLVVGGEENAEIPFDNGNEVDFKTVFADVGWQLDVRPPTQLFTLPVNGVWNKADLHNALSDISSPGLDDEWCYRLLVVKDLDPVEVGNYIGIMFDNGDDDLNGIPREGFAVGANFAFSTSNPDVAAVAGMRVAEVPGAYFRATVHELGHAMGLSHEVEVPNFMTITDNVAELGRNGIPFPDNIAYQFSPKSRFRLQHWPDVEVRPGGPYRMERDGSSGLPPLPRITRVQR